MEEYQLKSVCKLLGAAADLDSGLCVQFYVRDQVGEVELFNNFEFGDFLFSILADTKIHQQGRQ